MPTALVTGSNRGIGIELARQLAEQGWTVIATCRKPETADKLQQLAAEVPGRIELLPLDTADHGSIKALVAKLRGRPIDLLMCNAGIAGPKPPVITGKEGERIQDYGDDTWFEVLRTNLLGPVRIAGYLAENVAASERKLIGFVTSRMANIEENNNGAFYMYRASKAALNTAIKNSLAGTRQERRDLRRPASRLGAHRLCADRAGRAVRERRWAAQGDARRDRRRQRALHHLYRRTGRMVNAQELPVLIVGGGPVGLTTALGLSFYGLRFELLEEDEMLSTDTKAGGTLTRSIEILRRYGVADEVLQKALRIDEIGDIDRATNQKRLSVETYLLKEETRYPFV